MFGFFQSPLNVVFYEVCLVLLGFHLWHGFSSAFESLGGDEPRYTPQVLLLGKVLAVVHRRRLRLHPAVGVLRRRQSMTPLTVDRPAASSKLDARIPAGPIAEKWDRHRFEMKLVSPANRRKFTVIVVGTGLAGGAAAASLGELGYNVLDFCIQDSPRRAHSIAAQGGINAAKNYQNDGDSVQRLFYDTIKGGDYRAREANVFRLAQLSVNIIDQCVAQGVPFAREYGGLLDNRSFGGAQVSRTFYARGPDGPAAAARRLPVADAAGARGHGARSSRAARCSTSSSWTAGRAASSSAT